MLIFVVRMDIQLKNGTAVDSLRDQRQKQFANVWIRGGKKGILHLCPRFGKIRTAIHALRTMNNPSVLIAYPDLKIEKSWRDEMKIILYENPSITYTTHLSLFKHVNERYDVIILDEIHLLSAKQIEVVKHIMENNHCILGLTGTLSRRTENTLGEQLGLVVLAEYPIEQAIKEGIVPDYEITVTRVALDLAEKVRFDNLSRKIEYLERAGKDTMFKRLERMRVIQNSTSKLRKTRELLSLLGKERILVFCGITEIADSLGIPSYHSKVREKQIFLDFAEGKGNHLAVCKIGNTGITYVPLNRVIINYFDSNPQNLTQRINRCMSLEYNNPEKKAKIDIIMSTEDVERKWLKRALEFFEPSKIKYI